MAGCACPGNTNGDLQRKREMNGVLAYLQVSNDPTPKRSMPVKEPIRKLATRQSQPLRRRFHNVADDSGCNAIRVAVLGRMRRERAAQYSLPGVRLSSGRHWAELLGRAMSTIGRVGEYVAS
jgi:hypothetical protein